jgi:hypothetical protein
MSSSLKESQHENSNLFIQKKCLDFRGAVHLSPPFVHSIYDFVATELTNYPLIGNTSFRTFYLRFRCHPCFRLTEKHLCRAGLVAPSFPHAPHQIKSTKVHFSTLARLATNAMLQAGIFVLLHYFFKYFIFAVA